MTTGSDSALREEIVRLRARLEELEAQVGRRRPSFSPEGVTTVLVCRAGRECFGLPLSVVDSAIMFCALVAYPEAPPWIPGLLNFHGRLVPVVDVGARVHRHPRTPRLSDYIVLCTLRTGSVGLVVDEVQRIHRISEAETKPVPSELPFAPYVRAIADFDGIAGYLLDVSCLVASSGIPGGDGVAA